LKSLFPRLVPTVEDEAVPEGKPQEEIKENQHPDGMFARCKTQAEAVSCGFIVEKYKNFYENCYLVMIIMTIKIAFTLTLYFGLFVLLSCL